MISILLQQRLQIHLLKVQRLIVALSTQALRLHKVPVEKEIKTHTFYAKNGAAATTDVYFQVEVSINSGSYTSAGTIIVGPNSQATIEKTNLSNGNTIRWRYKTSKDNVTYSTDFTESSIMTITCISGDDVSVSIPTDCNSDGTKTATVTTVNNSSSDKFY